MRGTVLLSQEGYRDCRREDFPRITGFLLGGQGYGDLICSLPTLDEAIRLLGRSLDVWTSRPEIFQEHPKLRAFSSLDSASLRDYIQKGGLLIVAPVLESPLERFYFHLVEHTARGIVSLPADRKRPVFPSNEKAALSMESRLAPYSGRRIVVIHPSVAGSMRTWPEQRWAALAEQLAGEFLVIAIGKDCEFHQPAGGTVGTQPARLTLNHADFLDWTNTLSLHESYELMRRSELVITTDSGVLHLAGCTETPIVAIFTDVDPQLRMRFGPDGKPGWRTTAVSAPCEKQFCASRQGSTACLFENDSRALQCIPSVEQVLAAARNYLTAPSQISCSSPSS